MSEQNPSQFSLRNLYETAEKSTASFLDGFTEAVLGKAESLRNGSELEPVELPRDLYAHHESQTEWWYYTGHAATENGNRFGFELVFFKRRTDLDRFGPIPVRLLGNPIYLAHFAVTDYQSKNFQFSHRKSSNGFFDYPASASEESFHLTLGDWSIREAFGKHILRASIGEDLTFEASLSPKKELILNGKNKDGVALKDEGEASRYFSYTRMEMEGDISWHGKTEHFKGSSWMDREFGTWAATKNQTGWDWFSIQLENDIELMCYQLRDNSNGVSPFSSGVFVEKNGEYFPLSKSEYSIKPTGYWKSPQTKTVYPSGWKINVERFDLRLIVNPIIENQELDTRGTTMIIYWEGACEVIGKYKGRKITGNAYVELVGYDRSHERPNLAYFLWGSRFDFLPNFLSGN
jgi:predicted secreted hydrolase